MTERDRIEVKLRVLAQPGSLDDAAFARMTDFVLAECAAERKTAECEMRRAMMWAVGARNMEKAA